LICKGSIVKIFVRSLRFVGEVSLVAALALGAGGALAWEGRDHGGGGDLWPRHSTLPVPAALIFGGLAISAAAAAARRRKSKDAEASKTEDQSPGADK
jgi:hypothetical protein